MLNDTAEILTSGLSDITFILPYTAFVFIETNLTNSGLLALEVAGQKKKKNVVGMNTSKIQNTNWKLILLYFKKSMLRNMKYR